MLIDMTDRRLFIFVAELKRLTRAADPLANADSISFAETLESPHIGLHEGSTLQHFLNRVVADSGNRLQLRIQVRGFDAMCRMVEASVGIGMPPPIGGAAPSSTHATGVGRAERRRARPDKTA